jgi:hypothetical protein
LSQRSYFTPYTFNSHLFLSGTQAAIDATKEALPDFSHPLLTQCEEIVAQINACQNALSEAIDGRVIGMQFTLK